MIKTVLFICSLLLLLVSENANSQENPLATKPFSKWNLRVNPLSFLEQFGGVHLGVETNINKSGRLYYVSEFGYIFINHQDSYSESDREKGNKNPLSGFRTKQELKWVMQNKKERINSFFAFEVNYLSASISNSGWFGMGATDAMGAYPYFKYQDFKENVQQVSAALKYVFKAYPFSNDHHNLEFFTGLGLRQKYINYKGASGVLVQPDADTLEDVQENNRKDVQPYLAVGFRLIFRLK